MCFELLWAYCKQLKLSSQDLVYLWCTAVKSPPPFPLPEILLKLWCVSEWQMTQIRVCCCHPTYLMALCSQKAVGGPPAAEAWLFVCNKFSIKSRQTHEKDFTQLSKDWSPCKFGLQYFKARALESGNKESATTGHRQRIKRTLCFSQPVSTE